MTDNNTTKKYVERFIMPDGEEVYIRDKTTIFYSKEDLIIKDRYVLPKSSGVAEEIDLSSWLPNDGKPYWVRAYMTMTIPAVNSNYAHCWVINPLYGNGNMIDIGGANGGGISGTFVSSGEIYVGPDRKITLVTSSNVESAELYMFSVLYYRSVV